MEKNSPPKIDDTWYFRGKFMENLPLLQDGEYLWHKVQNCRRCGAKRPRAAGATNNCWNSFIKIPHTGLIFAYFSAI